MRPHCRMSRTRPNRSGQTARAVEPDLVARRAAVGKVGLVGDRQVYDLAPSRIRAIGCHAGNKASFGRRRRPFLGHYDTRYVTLFVLV
jgi:hypothetical protein